MPSQTHPLDGFGVYCNIGASSWSPQLCSRCCDPACVPTEILLVFAVAVEGRLDVNVALNRPSYQVSIYTDGDSPFSYPPNYANDGNHGTDLWSGPCSATNPAINPWWAVDLLVPLYVAGIQFTNRDGWGTSADIYFHLGVGLRMHLTTNQQANCSLVHMCHRKTTGWSKKRGQCIFCLYLAPRPNLLIFGMLKQ